MDNGPALGKLGGHTGAGSTGRKRRSNRGPGREGQTEGRGTVGEMRGEGKMRPVALKGSRTPRTSRGVHSLPLVFLGFLLCGLVGPLLVSKPVSCRVTCSGCAPWPSSSDRESGGPSRRPQLPEAQRSQAQALRLLPSILGATTTLCTQGHSPWQTEA